MKRLVRTTTYGLVAAAALCLASGPSFANEPGDYQPTLAGATIGNLAGAMPPRGFYFNVEYVNGINGVGIGQNKGITSNGNIVIPALLWSTGRKFLGGNVGLVVIQPHYTNGVLESSCTVTPVATGPPNCINAVPVGSGRGVGYYENIHNTVFQAIDSWNWKNGWFTSLGFGFQGPDGSTYNGTLNQDYWTYSPLAGVSYIDKKWKATANFDYDIHTASNGHTGSYAFAAYETALGSGPLPGLPGGIESIGKGYRSGDPLYIDWSAEYRLGKLAFGPGGDFIFQTTSDRPGAGLNCATLGNLPFPTGGTFGTDDLGCGKIRKVAVGGVLSYDLGLADVEVFATRDVYTKDEFNGTKLVFRVSFKLAKIVGKKKT
jgi:hypothetical protein